MLRRGRFPKETGKEEDEAEIMNELRALNMLEDGMSVEDRRDLLKVVRMSETTAEEEQRTRSNRKKVKIQEEEEPKESEQPIPLSEGSKSSSVSSLRDENEYCSESVERITRVGSKSPCNISEASTNPSNDEEVNPVFSPRTADSSTVSLKNDHLKDKKRNINPFFVDKESYRDCFKRRKRMVYLRFPYDLLAQGMDVDSFSAQFKKYSINYARKLETARNKRLNSAAWSRPIIGPTFTLPNRQAKDYSGSQSIDYRSNNRYNFRGRQAKITRDDLECIEDSSDDEVVQIPQKVTESRKRKTNNCNKNSNSTSVSGTFDENTNKEKPDILDVEVEDKCTSESAINARNKFNERSNVPVVTRKFFTGAHKRSSDQLETNRESPPLVIVEEEVSNGKKLFLQENLLQSETKEVEIIEKKEATSPDSGRTSPIVSLKRIPQRRTSLLGYSDHKGQVTCEPPPLVIVDESDDKSEPVQSSTINSKNVNSRSPHTPVTSPSVSVTKWPLSDVPNRSGQGSSGINMSIERSNIQLDKSSTPLQNITKRRRLDISFSGGTVQDVAKEERIVSERQSPSILQDNEVQEITENKIVCPICSKLFNSNIIQEHASECDQYIDEPEEVGRGVNLRAKRSRNNL